MYLQLSSPSLTLTVRLFLNPGMYTPQQSLSIVHDVFAANVTIPLVLTTDFVYSVQSFSCPDIMMFFLPVMQYSLSALLVFS